MTLTKTILIHKLRSQNEEMMTDDVIGQRYDPHKNQLPYGGAVDISGRIVWVVSEEEDRATKERINKAFGRK